MQVFISERGLCTAKLKLEPRILTSARSFLFLAAVGRKTPALFRDGWIPAGLPVTTRSLKRPNVPPARTHRAAAFKAALTNSYPLLISLKTVNEQKREESWEAALTIK